MDIFDEILKYNEKKIIIIFDTNGNIWFGLRDILNMLEYTSIDKAINKFIISDYNKKKYSDIHHFPQGKGASEIKYNTTFINESGLYQVLTKSTKPIANLFMQKYLIEIMPEIRKTGKYIMNDKDKSK